MTKIKKDLSTDMACRSCLEIPSFSCRIIIVNTPSEYLRYDTLLCRKCININKYSPLSTERVFDSDSNSLF